MNNPRAEKLTQLITTALSDFESVSPRSLQSREGILGPSDIGFCRQKAALVTKQILPTDNPPRWAAAVGTAIHNYVEHALKITYPDWIVGSIDQLTVTALLPSGAEITGHPDLVVPSANAVLDIKTVDGFAWVKRSGTSQSHVYQRHLYALGLIQSGLLSTDTPVLVGNIYFDRSGKEPAPLVITSEFDPAITDEIDRWVTDVIYAVQHGEDASRDQPAAVCERICEFFTVCRGGLEVHDGQDIITDQSLISAIDMYVDGRQMEKDGKAMKDAASVALAGINGSTTTHQVRWTHVNPTVVQSFEKAGYDRLDVRPVRKTS